MLDEWPKVLDIKYIRGDGAPWEWTLVGLGNIAGLASTLKIESIGTLTGSVIDDELGTIGFDPDDLPALLTATPGAYDYTMTLDPTGSQKRVVLEGQVLIRAARVP